MSPLSWYNSEYAWIDVETDACKQIAKNWGIDRRAGDWLIWIVIVGSLYMLQRRKTCSTQVPHRIEHMAKFNFYPTSGMERGASLRHTKNSGFTGSVWWPQGGVTCSLQCGARTINRGAEFVAAAVPVQGTACELGAVNCVQMTPLWLLNCNVLNHGQSGYGSCRCLLEVATIIGRGCSYS